MPKKGTFDFEKELQVIEQLVRHLEDGNVPLDEAFKTFESGVKHVKQCQMHLSKVEQKVSKIIEKNGEFLENSFYEEEDNEK